MSGTQPRTKQTVRAPIRRGQNVVLAVYLAVGAIGIAYLAWILSAPEPWIGVLLITIWTSAIGWIPGVFLIVVYRRSWAVVAPAVILIACLGLLITNGALDDLTIGLTVLFYLSAFLAGVTRLIRKYRNRHTD
jgi:hypothetical protein